MQNQSGLSLVELLVAVTILSLATVVALTVYDQANRSFKRGENESEQQQASRIAFDIISADLRMAGFNINPDGNEARPDEAIEAAFPTALVVRADFDYADPLKAATPESALSGAAFLSVSTGNDEIRAYVLAKTVGPNRTGPDTLSFQADISTPRDGAWVSVPITGVALNHVDPPYTLYRISINDAGNPVSTVLIENVYALNFRYFDRAGNELLPPTANEVPPSVKAMRQAIRRINVEIEVLTRDPDPQFTDTSDPYAATRKFRKFRMAGDITPRNLGMSGIKDLQSDTVAPAKPDDPDLSPGHCGGLYVSWDPNPAVDEVDYYRIHYFQTSPLTPTRQRATSLTHYYLGGLQDGTSYTVAIQAVDAAGNVSSLSTAQAATTVNTNTPRVPLNLVATETEYGKIGVTWEAVSDNTGATPGDLESPILRELGGYRLYRGESGTFSPGPGNRIADESMLGIAPLPLFTDTDLVNCRTYHYIVTAVDRCGTEGAPSESAFTLPESGRSRAANKPKSPTYTQAFLDPGGVRIEWDPVAEDMAGLPIHVEEYEIFRTGLMALFTFPNPGDFVGPIGDGNEQFIDDLSWTPSGGIPSGRTIWYRVRTTDDCEDNESQFGDMARPYCEFIGRVEINAPLYGAQVSGSTPISIGIVGGTGDPDDYDALIKITNMSTRTVSMNALGSGTSWSYDWDAELPNYGPATYEIRAEITYDDGGSGGPCQSLRSTTVVIPN